MRYQLVIQFPQAFYDDIDSIADLEDKLDELILHAEVDGHDIGSGEVNIFIQTNDPNNTFKIVKDFLKKEVNFEYAKIAYREIGKEQYTILWPKNLQKFNVI